MDSSFGNLPSSTKDNLTPFTVDIPKSELDELRSSLKNARIGAPTYESGLEDERYGVSRKWLKETKEYWLEQYNWWVGSNSISWSREEKRLTFFLSRIKHQEYMNSFPQFIDKVVDQDGRTYSIHFTALFSRNPAAIPLLLLHGWPGLYSPTTKNKCACLKVNQTNK